MDWRGGRDAIMPFWRLEMDHSDYLQRRLRGAEQVVLALRRLLIAQDPSLPNEYDGTAWAEIEHLDEMDAA